MKKKNIKIKNIKKQVPNNFEKWLQKSIGAIAGLYGVGNVSIFTHEKKIAASLKSEGEVALFRINYSVAYKTANLWYYPYAVELFEKKSFDVLRQAITHEIAHILTNPLADLAYERHVSKRELEEAIESLTESIGQLGRKLLDEKKIEI